MCNFARKFDHRISVLIHSSVLIVDLLDPVLSHLLLQSYGAGDLVLRFPAPQSLRQEAQVLPLRLRRY